MTGPVKSDLDSLSRDTIRFYEKQGFISVGRKQRRDNNYKEYSPQMLDRLLTVKRMKAFGFTLNEAKELLVMIDGNQATCSNVSTLIEQKVAVLDERIMEMISLRNQMLSGVKKCINCCNPEKSEDNCPILISDHFE
jgi:DNA-binding transcriptional MerR regulator